MLKFIALNTVLLGLCAGCASVPPLKMTFHSDPEGATLYERGRLWGATPVTLSYEESRAVFARHECLRLSPMHVRWASGVVTTVDNLQACPAGGLQQAYVFARPADAPGAEIDANFARQLQRDDALQEKVGTQDASVVAGLAQTQSGK